MNRIWSGFRKSVFMLAAIGVLLFPVGLGAICEQTCCDQECPFSEPGTIVSCNPILDGSECVYTCYEYYACFG